MPLRSTSAPSRGWPAAATAFAALRDYRATAALIAAAAALALAAVLPVASLFELDAGGLRGRAALPPLPGGDLGLAWNGVVHLPAELRARTVASLHLLLLGSALATLALAAVTILGLCVVREAERSRDLGVRRAVGAGRRVLRRAAALEAGGLVFAALLAGGLAAALAARLAAAAWPGPLGPGGGAPVTAVMLVVAAVMYAGILLPVALPRRRITGLEDVRPAPLAPAALQLAVGLVALVLGGQLGRRAAELAGPAAHRSERGAVYPLALPADTAPVERARRWAGLLDGLERPGRFDSVSLISPGALLGLGPVGTVTTDCGRCSEGGIFLPWRVKPATHHLVSADSFQALDLALLEGRAILPEDDWDSPQVAVVSRSLAAGEFQDGRAIGRRIRVVDDGAQWSTVVGVVDDREPAGLGGALQPRYAVYLSVLQHPPAALDLLFRPGATGGRRLEREAIARLLGPGASTGAPRAETEVFAAEAAPLDWFLRRLEQQGWAMLALAGLGAFALVRLWVLSVRRELGVRRAAGATRRAVLAFVLARAAGMAAAGVALGLWIGGSIWGVLPELLGGAGWPPGLVARLALLLAASVLAAALPPAWRAARSSPTALLDDP